MPQEKKEPKGYAMKWAITVIVSSLLAVSTIWRLSEGKEVDPTLCWAFTAVAGLVWGANVADKLFIKK